jgi:hypothetical protein
MRISDILEPSYDLYQISQHERNLLNSCDQFIAESRGCPLIKNLSANYNDFAKVKVRFHSRHDVFIETFNNAFEDIGNVSNLHQRAIFANGEKSFRPKDNAEPYYIFPITGYKFMYNKNVANSNTEFKHTFDELLEQFDGGDNTAVDIVTQLLQYTYVSQDLHEGIVSGSEVVLYNIPFYYAIKQKSVGDYDSLLSSIQQ